jgi:hypothetical protein
MSSNTLIYILVKQFFYELPRFYVKQHIQNDRDPDDDQKVDQSVH